VPTNAGVDTELAREERHALGWAALAAVALIVWLMRPVGMGMLLGALMAFTFQPIYERILRRWPAPLAAIATVFGSTLTIALTFGGLIWLLVRDGTMLGQRFLASLGPGGGTRQVLASLAHVTSKAGITVSDLEAKARALIDSAVARAASIAEAIASTTAGILLALFFLMLTMYFILRQWPLVSATAQDTLPLQPQYTRKLIEEFRRVGRTTLLSTVLTGFVQGTLATIGYFIVGLPYPLFFGALTTLCSPVPGVGTMLVWVPAGIVLILLGHPVRGVVLLAWGVLVVTGIPDYVIRPRLVGHKSEMPALLTFASLFGGVAVLGLKGLILGPVFMALAIAVWRIYADEARARRALQSG
jgi:predicted PurR-regulated permease PerM